jgi:hypothetical protein
MPMQLSEVPHWPGVIETADVNNDRVPDILVTYDVLPQGEKKFDEFVAVFTGDGTGGFAHLDTLLVDAEFTYAIAVGDIDADGYVDFAVNSYRTKQVIIYAGQGDGTFVEKSPVKTVRKPGELRLVDIDADGHVDLVVTYFAHVRVFLGDGAFGFRGQRALAVDQAPEKPVDADFDGDGRVDLGVVSNDRNKVFVLDGGKGDGTFGIEPIGTTCGSPAHTYGADFDGNGAVDMAYGCMDGQIEVRLNDGQGGFSAAQHSAPHVEFLAGGDFTGDGRADLLAMGRPGTFNGSDLILFANDGAGGFEQLASSHVDGTLTNPVVTDVDGDGRQDVVAAYWPGREPGFLAVFRSAPCRAP